MTTGKTWRVSSHSSGQNNCVETAVSVTGADIRDTKSRASGTLALASTEWTEFLNTVKSGELDR